MRARDCPAPRAVRMQLVSSVPRFSSCASALRSVTCRDKDVDEVELGLQCEALKH